MLLSILQARGSPSQQRIMQSEAAVVLRLRNPEAGSGPEEEGVLWVSAYALSLRLSLEDYRGAD